MRSASRISRLYRSSRCGEIYSGLGLPDFDHARLALERYSKSLAGYQKNVFPELPAEMRERIGREWRRCFDEWGYPL